MGELFECWSATEGGEGCVDEEVLSRFVLEGLPMVGSGDPANEGEGGTDGSEQLVEGVLVREFPGAGEAAAVGEEVDEGLQSVEVFFESLFAAGAAAQVDAGPSLWVGDFADDGEGGSDGSERCDDGRCVGEVREGRKTPARLDVGFEFDEEVLVLFVEELCDALAGPGEVAGVAGEELLGAGGVSENVVDAGCGGGRRCVQDGFDPRLEFFGGVELLDGRGVGESAVAVGSARPGAGVPRESGGHDEDGPGQPPGFGEGLGLLGGVFDDIDDVAEVDDVCLASRDLWRMCGVPSRSFDPEA